jgi:ribosome maturation factor RimP
VRAGETDLTVEVPAAKKQPARTEDFRYADLSRAVVQVEFSRGHDSTQGSQGEADDAAETDFSDNTDEEN